MCIYFFFGCRLEVLTTTGYILQGKPSDRTMSGVKRKQSTPPLYAAASSSGVSPDTSKKITEEWSCVICKVSATSAGGLEVII